MRNKSFLAPVLSVLLLAACAGATPWENPQQYAGVSHWEITFEVTPEGNPYVKHAEIWDGKEGDVKVVITLPTGHSFDYTAEAREAFLGQQFRAELEARLAEVVGESSSDIAEVVMPVIRQLVTGGL